eukprot:690022-Amphidinium_carterae.1
MKSNGGFRVEGFSHNSVDFSCSCKEAAWYSQPSAETDHPTAERTQRWAWTAGQHRKFEGLSLKAVVAWLRRPWWKPVMRIGEAKNPGPL